MDKYIFAAPRLKTKTPCPCPSDSCRLFAESTHGSYAAYTLRKCRCEPCRDANAIYQRDLRKRQDMVDSGEVARDDSGMMPRLDKGSNLEAPVKRKVSPNEIQIQLPSKNLFNDPEDPRHGTIRGYDIGCPCDPCKNAKMEYQKQYTLDKLQEMQNDPNHKFHGTGHGYNYGCRCDGCSDAQREYSRQRYIKNKKQSSMWYERVNWYEL
jgi:hypothetical protein